MGLLKNLIGIAGKVASVAQELAAKQEAAAYLRVLEHCGAETMVYPE